MQEKLCKNCGQNFTVTRMTQAGEWGEFFPAPSDANASKTLFPLEDTLADS